MTLLLWLIATVTAAYTGIVIGSVVWCLTRERAR